MSSYAAGYRDGVAASEDAQGAEIARLHKELRQIIACCEEFGPRSALAQEVRAIACYALVKSRAVQVASEQDSDGRKHCSLE